MRTFLLLFSFLSLSFFVDAQSTGLERVLDIQFKQNTLAECFLLLETAADLRFAYNDNDLPGKRFTAEFKERTVEYIIESLLKNSGLTYRYRIGRIIVFKDKRVPSKVTKKAPTPYFTLSGYVRDSATGEALIGSIIQIGTQGRGVMTNAYGFYSITLPSKRYDLTYRYLGYHEQIFEVTLDSNQRLDINLPFKEQYLPNIVVSSSKDQRNNLADAHMGRISMTATDIRSQAALLGEPDVIRAIQMMPGVEVSNDGSFSVRSGNSDHNLILLDEAPIYNPVHLAGLVSIFNADAINGVDLIKGDIPAEHRGRLGSVFDVRMKDGNNKQIAGKGGIGLMSSRFMLEGNLGLEKGSFMVAGRRTYLDLIIDALVDEGTTIGADDDVFLEELLSFSDFNAKINFQLGKNDRLFLSGYLGRDFINTEEIAGIRWGNTTMTARWNHLFDDQLFLNSTFVISDYNFLTGATLDGTFDIGEGENSGIQTRIIDFRIKESFQYYPRPGEVIKFGMSGVYHIFTPADIVTVVDQRQGKTKDGSKRKALELSSYGSYEGDLNDNWRIRAGVHFTSFAALGANEYVKNYNDQREVIDSTFYKNGEIIKSYFGMEPRISLSYRINNASALKLSANHTIQYIQQISSSVINNPAAVWISSNETIRPQRANQFAIGYYAEVAQKRYEFSAELYYNQRFNQITFIDGANLNNAPQDIESQLSFGRSYSYGLELLLKKPEGRLRGWIGGSIGRAKNRFDDINDERFYSHQNERRFSGSISLIWEMNKRCQLSANWVVADGKVQTVPTGRYFIDGKWIDYYEGQNNLRLPIYHRMDMSLLVRNKQRKERKWRTSWVFSIYNVYARRNPFYVFFTDAGNGQSAEYLSLVRVVPSVAFNFEF